MHTHSLCSTLRGCASALAFFAIGVLALAETPAKSAEPAAKPAEIIYPRSTAAADNAPAVAGKTNSGSSTMLLGLALVAAGVGGWMVWRQRQAPGGLGGRVARKLDITESRSLGNRQYLVVADYDGRKFLLGVCPGRIDLLSPLDEKEKAS